MTLESKTILNIIYFFYSQQESSKCADEKQSVEKEKEILRKYCPVLNAFLNGNNDLQLVAIYAMQVYWYSIDFPKGRSMIRIVIVPRDWEMFTFKDLTK